MKVILNAERITKRFSSVLAVNELSLHINEGEIFALLGPNGAGKTTTVRMLMNIIKPDSGNIEYSFSSGVYDRNMLGYLPEERGLYQEQSILKTLTYMGVIRGMDKKESKRTSEKWLERLELQDRAKDKINTLSKGNQQKIQFIASIIHKPSFAVLDEPFSGFDPLNQESFISIIRELRDEGTTILLSAHQMHLVEMIADRILLINKGTKITEGTIEQLNNENRDGVRLKIKLNTPGDFAVIKALPYVNQVNITDDNEIDITLDNENSISAFLSFAAANFNIKEINTIRISLHDIFLQKVKGEN